MGPQDKGNIDRKIRRQINCKNQTNKNTWISYYFEAFSWLQQVFLYAFVCYLYWAWKLRVMNSELIYICSINLIEKQNYPGPPGSLHRVFQVDLIWLQYWESESEWARPFNGPQPLVKISQTLKSISSATKRARSLKERPISLFFKAYQYFDVKFFSDFIKKLRYRV